MLFTLRYGLVAPDGNLSGSATGLRPQQNLGLDAQTRCGFDAAANLARCLP